MYFMKTLKKFFKKDGSLDLYFFILGLVFLYTFALVNMGKVTWFIGFSFSILISLVFRYISTDEDYYDDLNKKSSVKDSLAYVLSKNIFAFIFTTIILLLVFSIFTLLGHFSIIERSAIDRTYFPILFILVLASENIILIFNHKKIKSYDGGLKRDYQKDIRIGLKSLVSLLPSLVSNIFFTSLLFYFEKDISLTLGLLYLLLCTLALAFYRSFGSIE